MPYNMVAFTAGSRKNRFYVTGCPLISKAKKYRWTRCRDETDHNDSIEQLSLLNNLRSYFKV